MLSAIKRYDRIAIFRHIMPDYDALGSQMGLATWIKDNFPNKEVHVLGDNVQSAQPILLGKVSRTEISNMETPLFKNEEYLLCDPQIDFLEKIERKKQEANYFFTSYYLNEKETRSNFHILYTLPPSKIRQLKEDKLLGN